MATRTASGSAPRGRRYRALPTPAPKYTPAPSIADQAQDKPDRQVKVRVDAFAHEERRLLSPAPYRTARSPFRDLEATPRRLREERAIPSSWWRFRPD